MLSLCARIRMRGVCEAYVVRRRVCACACSCAWSRVCFVLLSITYPDSTSIQWCIKTDSVVQVCMCACLIVKYLDSTSAHLQQLWQRIAKQDRWQRLRAEVRCWIFVHNHLFFEKKKRKCFKKKAFMMERDNKLSQNDNRKRKEEKKRERKKPNQNEFTNILFTSERSG